MKFARYIQGLELDCPPEWHGKFIRYKELKKLLKPISGKEDPNNGDVVKGDEVVTEAAETRFFETLRSQMEVVDREFDQHARALITNFKRSHAPYSGFCFPFVFGKGNQAARNVKQAQDAYWCRKYAKANAVALRKILKKHDKLAHNALGRDFLRDSWQSRGNAGVGIFLHSPLLDEIKAIQDVLSDELVHEPELEGGEDHPPAVLVGTNEASPAEDSSVLGEAAEVEPPVASAEVANEIDALTDGVALGPSDEDASKHRCASSSPGIALETRDINSNIFEAASDSNTPALSSSAPLYRQSPTLSSQGTASDPGRRTGIPLSVTSGSTAASPVEPQRLRHIWTHGAHSFISTSSLRRQREEGLHAICESPSFLLDSSDEEWEESAMPAWARRPPFDPASMPIAEESEGSEARGSSPVAAGSSPPPPVGASLSSSPRDRGSASGGPKAPHRFRDTDLTCPICLDLMYKPVALACAHKFCKRCALEAAGFGRAVGTFASICSYVPRRTPCPSCRQVDVYRGAISLREVGRLIEQRHPEEWAARRAQDKQMDRSAADEAMKRQREIYAPRMRATSLYDLVF